MLDSIRHAMTTHLAITSADANAKRSVQSQSMSAPGDRIAKRRKLEETSTNQAPEGKFPSALRCDAIAPGAGHVVERDSFNYKHAFWTATCGGAELLGLKGKVGRLVPGQAFDACVVDLNKWLVEIRSEAENDSTLTAFEKFLHLGSDADITAVYVQGCEVTQLEKKGTICKPLGKNSSVHKKQLHGAKGN